jgi:hypothetical protein
MILSGQYSCAQTAHFGIFSKCRIAAPQKFPARAALPAPPPRFGGFPQSARQQTGKPPRKPAPAC